MEGMRDRLGMDAADVGSVGDLGHRMRAKDVVCVQSVIGRLQPPEDSGTQSVYRTPAEKPQDSSHEDAMQLQHGPRRVCSSIG